MLLLRLFDSSSQSPPPCRLLPLFAPEGRGSYSSRFHESLIDFTPPPSCAAPYNMSEPMIPAVLQVPALPRTRP